MVSVARKGGAGKHTQRVDQILTKLALQCDDLSARTADVRVYVERLPEVIDRGRTWPRAYVEQYAHIRLQDGPKGVEEPAVRVDLLLILLLETENDLNGNDAFVRRFNLEGR